MRILNLTAPNTIERRTVVRELHILTITHHFRHGVNTIDELAGIVGVSAKKVMKWTETKTWRSALAFWGSTTDRKPYRDPAEKEFMESLPGHLRRAAMIWESVIEIGVDLDPSLLGQVDGLRDENDYPGEIFDIENETELPAGEVQND